MIETLTEFGGWLWSQRSEITEALKGLRAWFRGGRVPSGDSGRGILILGAGGTGKTTLAKTLTGEYEPLFDAVAPYAESIGVEEYSLSDDRRVEIVVPPGQAHRREATWEDLLASLARGEYRGVILVSAFGYHTLGEISATFVASKPPSDPQVPGTFDAAQFVADYTEKQRADEIRILDRILAHLGRSGKRTWLLSVITKRDLWWPDAPAVEYYYTEGDYGRRISQFGEIVNRRLFRHELVCLSLTINRFVTGRGELLLNNAEGYDHPLHFGSQRRLFETIAALRDWESGS